MKNLPKTAMAAFVVSVCFVLICGSAIGSLAAPAPIVPPPATPVFPPPTPFPWAPAKVDPLNNAVTTNLPTLAWVPAEVPSTYDYCLSAGPSCSSPGWINTGTNNTVQPGTLKTGTCYYWQVRAHNSNFRTTYADLGAWWVFAVGQPSPPAKNSPKNSTFMQPTNPTLSWQPSLCGATSYRYCVSTTPSSSTAGCVREGTVPSSVTSVALSGLAPATTYYWQITAYNLGEGALVEWTYADADGGVWWSFTTRPAKAK